MKLIKSFIIFSLIIFTIISCSREPWGPLLEHRINTRNPKYRIELKTWEATRRLYVYMSGSKRKVVALDGGIDRFREVFWKDKDNLVVIDLEGIHSSQKHGVRKFKFGELTITNYCYIYIGGRLIKGISDSLSLENGLLTFYNTELDRSFQQIIYVPIDQYILSNKLEDNTIQFKTIQNKPTEPILDYNVTSTTYRIKLSDANISKLKIFMSQKME